MAQVDIGKLIEGYSDSFNKHDVDRLMQYYGDGCVCSDSLIGSLNGKDAVRGYFASLFGAFPDIELSVNSAIGGGDLLAVEWSTTGTNKGTLGPPLNLPPTNRKVEMAGASFITLREGKIAVENVYTDYGVMLEQLGVAPREVDVSPRHKEAGK